MKKSRVLMISLLLLCSALVLGTWYKSLKDSGTVSGSEATYVPRASLNDIPEAGDIPTDNGNTAVDGYLNADSARFQRNDDTVDFSSLTFTPWDVKAASTGMATRAVKPYTIMVYMNGSDLESENGAATDDLIEMLESGVYGDYVNLVLLTGGTNRWQNSLIPANECVIWEIIDGYIYEVSRVGLVNMGDPGTLASFIDFSVNNYPAEKYGLIMWDHGGGSIAGYGHDEKFMKSNLTLLDMNYAFKKSALSGKKLEFLGFDSCLMATVEMASVASPYANYLIASEDLEPGDGWNYKFLSVLNKNPGMDGAEFGRTVVDYFMRYYGYNSNEVLTMSVIDLSDIEKLVGSVESLMKKCNGRLLEDMSYSFNTLARRRNRTKTFGDGSPIDNDCDMVDIGDMARKLSDLYPNEAADVLNTLEKCVIYNKNNSYVSLGGLSTYYIYGGKEFGDVSLDMYGALKVNDEHSKYLNGFFKMLTAGNDTGTGTRSLSGDGQNASSSTYSQDDIIDAKLTLWHPVADMPGYFIMFGIRSAGSFDVAESMAASGEDILWPSISGQNICLYEINGTNNSSLYAIPSTLNGDNCDIVVMFSREHPEGRIMGVRREDGVIIQKGYDDIKDGDKISFYFQKRNFADNENTVENSWYKGDEFVVNGGLKLTWSEAGEDGYYGVQIVDVRQKKFFTEPSPIKK